MSLELAPESFKQDKPRRAELPAPAGNAEKLRFAVAYGADAVYFGLKRFSLRNFADNFDLDGAAQALRYLHDRGKKGYCALNIFPFEDEYAPLLDAARALDEMGVDGLIVSDVGVLSELKGSGIGAPIHVSTQANTVSPQTIRVLSQLSASRVNLARELSLDRIKALQLAIDDLDVETEVFIHGSVCFSVSGRCAISDYLTGRGANRGSCTQPCRWRYRLVEEKRPGLYLPVMEDDRGLYFFNAKDLALFPFVNALSACGVRAYKIEGRMKSIHYVAGTVSLYRRILDGERIDDATAMRLLCKVQNRGYSQGFITGAVGSEDYDLDESNSKGEAIFLGGIVDKSVPNGSVLNIRNRIEAGEVVEILKTDGTVEPLTLLSPLTEMSGKVLSFATHGKQILLPFVLPPYSILRKPSPQDG